MCTSVKPLGWRSHPSKGQGFSKTTEFQPQPLVNIICKGHGSPGIAVLSLLTSNEKTTFKLWFMVGDFFDLTVALEERSDGHQILSSPSLGTDFLCQI